jgi:hypothetical protein
MVTVKDTTAPTLPFEMQHTRKMRGSMKLEL